MMVAKMGNHKPHVSIGIPVFNGEKYLKHAVDSILAQTYQDFELIISDNASTDKTQEICREYVRKDSRIHYHRNKRNVGAARNFNRVFELSSGKYFKWAACDDVLATEFLSRCISILDKDSSVVLCHSKTGRIDENGVVAGTYEYKTVIDSRKPHERFGDVLSRKGFPWMIFGVIRKSTLGMTPLMRDYIGSDWNLLAEISLFGRIHEIPEYLFFRRNHPDAYTSRHYSKLVKFHNYSEESGWWTGRIKRGFTTLPHWRIYLEFFRSVKRAPLKWSERRLCYEEIGRWFIREGWRLMKSDIGCYLSSFRLMRAYLLARRTAHTK
jgi:glycosyltransferase involved in cell wall biosynthesis